MGPSIWYGQKTGASDWIKQTLADGQERTLDQLVDGLKAQGISRKNAMKALYTEVTEGTIVMTGKMESFRTAASLAVAPVVQPVSGQRKVTRDAGD